MIKVTIKGMIKDMTMATISEGEGGIGDRVFDVSYGLRHTHFSSLSSSMVSIAISVMDG